jgi:hypothetical protein
MFADDRLKQLRALIARLERLPASAETDWMLREARARMVDVETGEKPGAMRPLAEETPPPEEPRRRRLPVKRTPEPQAPPEPPARVVPEQPRTVPIDTEGLLWLEDSPSDEESSAADDEPWKRGLRG